MHLFVGHNHFWSLVCRCYLWSSVSFFTLWNSFSILTLTIHSNWKWRLWFVASGAGEMNHNPQFLLGPIPSYLRSTSQWPQQTQQDTWSRIPWNENMSWNPTYNPLHVAHWAFYILVCLFIDTEVPTLLLSLVKMLRFKGYHVISIVR